MLGWGVVAGPFYLVVGLALALSRPGFDLSRHALSLLMLGEWGWLQRANLALAGIMTIVAAVGMIRAIRSGRGLALGVLTSVYGGALVLSAVFAPDPMGGFPAGQADGTASLSGILHLLFGALGFAAVAAAAFAYAGWSRRVGAPRRAALGVVLGVVIVGGFFGGAAMATTAAGVGLLWLAVVAAWTWLAVASAHVYAWSPHPLGAR
ncbi:DUF998 domain-containing protein [Agromyces luteolus]|uniref:DUF998 domain-containing protein n=2 Tax=Agromyces luteolus TaxID=88373 RepID=A0A7C9LDW2_9MICO|nr:DUF998 domain-containing protein [Agromyces luteolus]